MRIHNQTALRSNLAIVLLGVLTLLHAPAFSQSIVIDHTCTDLSQIPDAWIDQAKADLHIAYQHTSHGSQLVTGMNALENYTPFGSKYDWEDDGVPSSALDLDDYGIPGCADLSQGDWIDENGVTPWVTATRNLLDNPANAHVNVIVWSWCSINGHDITRYLDNMEILVSEYPAVDFVFMTGHAEGQGEGGFIHTANEQIRTHCLTNGRILFDFADIENYDPDGAYYYDLPMWDDLDYNPGHANNWGQEWCLANDGSELEQLTTGDGVAGYDGCASCAHSNGPSNLARINCVLKGRAAWWMWARLAGWDGGGGGDSDGDGFSDAEETAYGSDPGDPQSYPSSADIHTPHDGYVDTLDLADLLSVWGSAGGIGDIVSDSIVNSLDLAVMMSQWRPST